MLWTQPSSAGSALAPPVHRGARTPASTAHSTVLAQYESPATGASFSGRKRTIEGSMEPPPPKRGRPSSSATKVAKEEAMHRIGLAWSKLGQPPYVQQLQAMNVHWSPLIDTSLVAGRLVTQLIFIDHPANSQQLEALEQALKGAPPLVRAPSLAT